MSSESKSRYRGTLLLVGLMVVGGAPAEGGGPFSGRPRRVAQRVIVPTGGSPAGSAPTPMLGTFYPTPVMVVRSNWPTGGGYSPLGISDTDSLSLYGPLSALRSIAAPVDTYSRGYDGRLYPTRSTAFSYPNLPSAAPVIYPTQATYYYGFSESGTPPWWKDATNWIDQN